MTNNRIITDSRLEDYTMLIFMVAGAVLCCLAGITVMNIAFGSFTDDPDFELYKLYTGEFSNEIDFYLQNMEREIAK
jgi:hypothetical protein